jgi:hypothetical protein
MRPSDDDRVVEKVTGPDSPAESGQVPKFL